MAHGSAGACYARLAALDIVEAMSPGDVVILQAAVGNGNHHVAHPGPRLVLAEGLGDGDGLLRVAVIVAGVVSVKIVQRLFVDIVQA